MADRRLTGGGDAYGPYLQELDVSHNRRDDTYSLMAKDQPDNRSIRVERSS